VRIAPIPSSAHVCPRDTESCFPRKRKTQDNDRRKNNLYVPTQGPHDLTLIDGLPTIITLTKLRSEVYENAMAVPSEAGGGLYGHLGAVMPAAEYIALQGAVAYVVAAHPGIQAPVAAQATAIQITQANRQHDKAVERFALHNSVEVALKQQILAAVDDRYVSTLQDNVLRYARVTSRELIKHLVENYSAITSEVLEKICDSISAEWNPDDGMETLYTRITATQQFATAAGAAHDISDSTTIHPALAAIDKTGVFMDACSDWRKLATADQTMAHFRRDFTHAWNERDRRISAKAAGYEALLTTCVEDKEYQSPTTPPAVTNPDVIVDSVKMFYCWTHGLGFSSSHTSATCNKKAKGHCVDATIKNRKGGSSRIQVGGNRRS